MMENRRFCRDLLSDLPVGLIENILVCLPISDAIKTSILSTKWRFRWTTIPHLVFKEKYMDMPIDTDIASSEEVGNCFKSYVTNTLFRHEGPLHKFKLVSDLPSCSDVHQWLLCLVRKDVKELILKMDEFSYVIFDVPSCLFSFQSLTFLQLSGCPLPPNFKGFLSLKTLILGHVIVPADTFQSVVAHFPQLETLELSVCQFGTPPPNLKRFLPLRSLISQYVDVPGTLMINAPKLKYLDLTFLGVKKVHLCTPLLVKLSLTVWVYKRKYNPNKKPFHCNYTEFFGGLANLETLTGVQALTKMGELKKFAGEGKIKYVGLSDACASAIRKAHAVPRITAVQLQWSSWTRDWDVEDEIIHTCLDIVKGFRTVISMPSWMSSETPL